VRHVHHSSQSVRQKLIRDKVILSLGRQLQLVSGRINRNRIIEPEVVEVIWTSQMYVVFVVIFMQLISFHSEK